MNATVSCPVAASHCPMSMPWAWNCWDMSWMRWLRSLWTIASGGSTSTSAPTAAVTAFVSSWRDRLSLRFAERLAKGRIPLLDGVELAEVLADPFVVEFRELHLLHGGDLDGEVGLALGALRGGREGQFVTDRSADELLVEVFGDPTLADLVGPVLGVEAEHLFAVAGGGDVERDVVAGGDGPVGVDERGMLAQLGGVGLGEIGVVHLDRRHLDGEIGVAVDLDRRADLAGGVELDGPRLLAVGDLDLRRGDQVDLMLTHRAGEVDAAPHHAMPARGRDRYRRAPRAPCAAPCRRGSPGG